MGLPTAGIKWTSGESYGLRGGLKDVAIALWELADE
jgi:hypothetical protein